MNRDVLKFIKTSLLFFLGIIVMDVLIGYCFDRLRDNMPNEVERVSKSSFALNRVNADIIIAGSSRAECHYVTKMFIDSLACSSYNIGGDGQGIVYCSILINSIIRRSTPKLIIWDLLINGPIGKETDLSLLHPYYKSNPFVHQAILDVEGKATTIKMLSNMYRYNSTGARILRAIFTPSSNFRYGYNPRPKTKRGVMLDRKDMIIAGAPDNYKIKKMEETFTLTNKAGTKIIVVISPMYRRYNKDNEAIKTIRFICEKHQVPFIDDSQLEQFIHNDELAYDSDHLNNDGAVLFTRLLLEQIKYYIAGQNNLISRNRPL